MKTKAILKLLAILMLIEQVRCQIEDQLQVLCLFWRQLNLMEE